MVGINFIIQLNSSFQPVLSFVQVTAEGPTVLELILQMPTDEWTGAEVWSVYEYVRGSTKLRLPTAYRAVLL